VLFWHEAIEIRTSLTDNSLDNGWRKIGDQEMEGRGCGSSSARKRKNGQRLNDWQFCAVFSCLSPLDICKAALGSDPLYSCTEGGLEPRPSVERPSLPKHLSASKLVATRNDIPLPSTEAGKCDGNSDCAGLPFPIDSVK
jgi:hypothetical protein